MKNSHSTIGRFNYGWEEETVFDVAEQHFRSLLEGIGQARKTIELAMYIFELDEVGEQFAQALCDAARRGVKVRVLVDGVGSMYSAEKLGDLLTAAGAEFRVYHPLPWYGEKYGRSPRWGSWLRKLRYFFSTVNRRDHRKFTVVDGRCAWCGNLNFSADHLGKKQYWRDYGAYVAGGAVDTLLANFDAVWFRNENKKQELPVRLGDFQLCISNISLRMRWLRNRKMAQIIRSAKQRVWISNAYFSPSRSLLRAIKVASRKGIEVRLIVAGRSDIMMFPLLTSTYYTDLLKKGVSIYEYQRGVLHAKVLLVDQRCIIGSTNFNHRSFYHDLELDVVLARPQSLQRLEEGLCEDMAGSRLISWSDVGPVSRSFWFGWLPRLLRYWM